MAGLILLVLKRLERSEAKVSCCVLRRAGRSNAVGLFGGSGPDLDLSLQGIHFKDEIIAQVKEMEANTKQQQFNADFFIMTETLNGLLNDLLSSFADKKSSKNKIAVGI